MPEPAADSHSVNSATTGASASTTSPGRIPARMHSVARAIMVPRQKASTSAADLAAGATWSAQKGDAERLDEAGGGQRCRQGEGGADGGDEDQLSPTCGERRTEKIAWKVSHSETKPLSGGSAEMAAQPRRKVTAVVGMRWISPPKCSMSRSPVAVSTAPAPRNSRLFEQRVIEHVETAPRSARAPPARPARWHRRPAPSPGR